ncbi:hypothetical protein ACO0SA_000718 [Hanseniaspora valbyensis]
MIKLKPSTINLTEEDIKEISTMTLSQLKVQQQQHLVDKNNNNTNNEGNDDSMDIENNFNLENLNKNSAKTDDIVQNVNTKTDFIPNTIYSILLKEKRIEIIEIIMPENTSILTSAGSDKCKAAAGDSFKILLNSCRE